MSQIQVYSKIKQQQKPEELRKFCQQKVEKILSSFHHYVLRSDGGVLLSNILSGFSDGSNSTCRLEIKIMDIVLNSMRKESTSLSHCGDVIGRLCMELSRVPADDLVRWCNDSIQSIVADDDVNMIWRDILPECLSVLTSFNTVKHCGMEMNSGDFKDKCVQTLLHCQWKKRQLVQLTAMFNDMQLSRNDHRQVVNKICSYIIDISPDELPPLVHQLLKLSKRYNIEVVLSHLSHYFNLKLYSKLELPSADSESTTLDIDEIVKDCPAELNRCLSTCLYHITQGAAESEMIRKHIKLWPKTQLLRSPFIINVALAVSAKGSDFRTVCLDAIKSAIEQRVVDKQMRSNSQWARTVIPSDVDIVAVLKVIIDDGCHHRQEIVLGLINLAFSLLAVSKLRPSAPTYWYYGKLILVRLSKAQPETAPHILSQLADKLIGDSVQRQYADCLHVLCKLTPVSVERCTQLTTILENCQPSATDYRLAAEVLDAVHPLINFSIRIRDTLILVCRKTLYSRNSAHRCLALSGFLSVLRHMTLPRSNVLSTTNSPSSCSSGLSYLTQLSVDLHATQQGVPVTSRVRNETVCLEVMSIIRRCLVQDAAVKQLLFTKISECTEDKPALHEIVLELLYEHLSKYLPDEETDNTPLLIDKCIQLTPTAATLVEPIGHFLYAIAQFLMTVEQEEDSDDILGSQSEPGGTHFKNKLSQILENLCAKDFEHIDMDNLTDLTPESKFKTIKVQLTLQCYETLLAHQIMQWKIDSTNVATTVYKLFKDYDQLLEQTKVSPKTKKGNKSTLSDTTQKSQKSQKGKGKAPVKVSNLVKERAGPFKALSCLWDLRFCKKFIELLYSERVSWSTLEQRNQILTRRDLHQWALRRILSVLTDGNLDKHAVFSYVPKIARVLYHRCICRFSDICDFDDQTALGCIEVFKACLTLLFSPNYSFKMDSFLHSITDLQDSSAAVNISTITEQVYLAQAKLEEESLANEREDHIAKKLSSALAQVTALLLDQLCVDAGIIVKLEEYVRCSKQECLSLVPHLLAVGASEQLLNDLLLKLTRVFGKIDEEDTSEMEDSEPNFPTVDSRTRTTILTYICSHLKSRFKCEDHLLKRARDLTLALNYTVQDNQQKINNELKELYKVIVIHLSQLTKWTSEVAEFSCDVGAGQECVLSTLRGLYTLLGTLAKQIQPQTVQLVRFESLLKLAGRKLSSVMDNLIAYVEGSESSGNNAKRTTKHIPLLVYAAEQFSKQVFLLANKAKVNFQQYMSVGNARDFKIDVSALQEMLNANEVDEASDNGIEDIADRATVRLSPVADNATDSDGGETLCLESSDEESSPRKRKKVT